MIDKELPKRVQQLLKVQDELKSLVEADIRLSQQLKATRAQVEETRSSLQASRSRWVRFVNLWLDTCLLVWCYVYFYFNG